MHFFLISKLLFKKCSSISNYTSNHAFDQPSEPLLQREETIPSSQPLRRLAETVKNHNFDHNDEKHNELDLDTRESKGKGLTHCCSSSLIFNVLYTYFGLQADLSTSFFYCCY